MNGSPDEADGTDEVAGGEATYRDAPVNGSAYWDCPADADGALDCEATYRDAPVKGSTYCDAGAAAGAAADRYLDAPIYYG